MLHTKIEFQMEIMKMSWEFRVVSRREIGEDYSLNVFRFVQF